MTGAARPLGSVRLVAAGLACCGLEVAAAVRSAGLPVVEDLATLAREPEPGPGLTVLIIAGTVTAALAPMVVAARNAIRGEVVVVALGACADSGGPYWDSYSVVPGADRLLGVDVYVPGCPPRPEALLDALEGLGVRVS